MVNFVHDRKEGVLFLFNKKLAKTIGFLDTSEVEGAKEKMAELQGKRSSNQGETVSPLQTTTAMGTRVTSSNAKVQKVHVRCSVQSIARPFCEGGNRSRTVLSMDPNRQNRFTVYHRDQVSD